MVTEQSFLEAALRRAADLVISLLILVTVSPLLLVIALAIMSAHDGPVIFRQSRTGRDRRPFIILKFRTMHASSDDQLHYAEVKRQLDGGSAMPGAVGYKSRTDPRVTAVGRVLRRYSLDELPQLVNVVRGEMSLVGPRPALTGESGSFPEWAEPRFAVKPGLTGLWQVEGRNNLTMPDMLRLDVQYAKTRTVWSDLWILLRTVPVVIVGRGAA